MEDKCMRCGKHEHQPGQRCPAKNAKYKDCHKIGHFPQSVPEQEKRAKGPTTTTSWSGWILVLMSTP